MKEYALFILLAELQIHRFGALDALRRAVANSRTADIPARPMRFNRGADLWVERQVELPCTR